MLIVRVELHSARDGSVKEIARMGIANVGGSTTRGDYRATTYRGRDKAALAQFLPQRRGDVRDYPRLAIHVWHLVARALIACGYAGKSEIQQPSDIEGDLFSGAVTRAD